MVLHVLGADRTLQMLLLFDNISLAPGKGAVSKG